jgi:hypothetical protein
MARAQFRKVHGKNGSGRFVVSEGIAPSTYNLAHPGLPTLDLDLEDDRFEIVIAAGTILSAIADEETGNTWIVPANGTGGASDYNDGLEDGDEITVPGFSTPIGCAQQHVLRPFDKGTSLATSWIREAFVEWPAVEDLNDDVEVGDLIRADEIGRPVKCTVEEASANPQIVIGRVIEVDKFALNFDDGLLSYMQFPSDPGALREVYAATKEGPYRGKLGIPANLDVPDVVGAIRAVLNV